MTPALSRDEDFAAMHKHDAQSASTLTYSDILMLGTADWNQTIATNQHYVAREIAGGSPKTQVFVESMGLRRPSFSRRDISRMARRVRGFLARRETDSAKRPVPSSLRVVSPMVFPWHKGLIASANKLALSFQLRGWFRTPGIKVLWTYTPVTYGLEKKARVTFYHCVDLLGEFPGVDRSLIHDNEARLASMGATAIASSQVVFEHLAERGFKKILLWPNVADTSAFARTLDESNERHRRRVVFAGNITFNKLDFAILRSLAETELEIILIGPIAEGGGENYPHLNELLAAGVKHHEALSLDKLAGVLSSASVGIIPYSINAYTRGVSPLKTFEYLASGLSVVSTNVPSVEPIEGHVWVERDVDSFVARVVSLCRNEQHRDVGEAVKIAELNSWARRGDEVRGLLSAIDPESGDTKEIASR